MADPLAEDGGFAHTAQSEDDEETDDLETGGDRKDRHRRDPSGRSTAPYRRIDTRKDDSPTNQSPLVDGEDYSWNIFAGVDVPANTVGISGNVTAATMDRSGFLTVWPGPEGGRPIASNVNVRPPNKTAAAGLVMPTDGRLFAFMSTTAHMIVDINGYWVN